MTFVTHPGADHAFDNPSPMFHHAEASSGRLGRPSSWLAAELPAALTCPTPGR